MVTHEQSYLENTYNFHHLRGELVNIFAVPDFELGAYAFFRGKTDRLRATEVAAISQRDVVISLRIGDFVHLRNATGRWKRCVYNRFLGFAYFELILSQMRFDRLFITSDQPFHSLVNDFQKYDPILVRNDTAIKTMAFIKKFDRIALSESTYSWWAAYLSCAREIYYPISKSGLWGINTRWNPGKAAWVRLNPMYNRDGDQYLRVDDARYKYVHQESGVIYQYRDAPGKRRREDFA